MMIQGAIASLLAASVLSGCVIGEDTITPDNPPPVISAGFVTEPALGAVIAGDPSTISLRVAGVYSNTERLLVVQVLANPDDLASWETIATTRASEPRGEGFAFTVDVRPVTAGHAARWPAGGVLRMRVVDESGYALPHDPAAPDDTVIAIANPAGVPAGWTYLLEKPAGSAAETLEYYAAIAAPPTLGEFMVRYGFPGDEIVTRYFNAGDLGIGREMHCRATQTPAGGLACYVRNFGIFGGKREEALALTIAGGTPLATVAMVYTPPIEAPNAVAFMVYGGDDRLITSAQLDTVGANTSIPQNCLNCHGGRSRYDAVANAVLGARFLPFDPATFAYAAQPELTFAAQEDRFRRLNRLVAGTAPTPAMREVIEGMFPLDDAPYDPAFVPEGWRQTRSDARVYREAIAPYCRGCHASFAGGADDPLALRTAAGFRALATDVMARLCGAGPRGMPAAEQTTLHFFGSSARALLLQWLGQPGACAPP